ncbi:MAG: glycoside hydrolase family 38 [Herbinix sp.]|nr:glycoside hydrolase family 38 [Herbinix sp.]
MRNRKWTMYIIHHSHTDIGYTDLQERIIYNHIDYIRTAVNTTKEGHKTGSIDRNFKWNCETYYCVEKFLEEATEEEKQDLYAMIKSNNIGLSATYLNFNDLVDKKVLNKRTKEMVEHFKSQGIDVKVAMNADVNGISLGSLDVLLDNGIEFLFTNIHTHHGMYPLYQNQKPYYWENKEGKKLLVFNGEHYNLGNALGLIYNKNVNFMTENYLGGDTKPKTHLETLKDNIDKYLESCEENGYSYNFIPSCISGVFSDNAPPNTDIIRTITAFNEVYGDEIQLEMVTIQEFYEKIKDQVKDAPVYKGDLNDWWANGVGSTPYAVKHYKEAQRMYHLCERLDSQGNVSKKELIREAEDNLLLYAEHTWGHSATITNPYDTMVQNLDIRKTSYASKAHEATAKNLNRIAHSRGDKLRYYDLNGKIKAINVAESKGEKVVEFYIEVWKYSGVKVICETSEREMITQLSSHPRGVLISFIDSFEAKEEKIYRFEEAAGKIDVTNTRVAYVGSERVKDIVNNYDPNSYKLPYQIENAYFTIAYEIGKGVTSFYNKVDDIEMLKQGDAKFFTPIYENTKIRTDVYEERRRLGRNIRGLHANKCIGDLVEVKIIEKGEIFTTVELVYELKGTYFSSVVIKLYNTIPKMDFKYKIAKNLSTEIESIYLPLTLNNLDATLYIDKSDSVMRPGIDQIPGTCMEYYLVDNGLVYETKENTILIQTKDAPLIYMGELKHHPILLCDNKEENNRRDVYSWIMNNTWETNFKMDLSGITEFCYTLDLIKTTNAEQSFQKMKDEGYGVVTFMINE